MSARVYDSAAQSARFAQPSQFAQFIHHNLLTERPRLLGFYALTQPQAKAPCPWYTQCSRHRIGSDGITVTVSVLFGRINGQFSLISPSFFLILRHLVMPADF
ncbi:MAG: hypothetical protein D8M52_08805 [Chlorobi bacterium]|nr:MAG: hypothetical protein F9K28_10155 [Bacteroidota bacterium]MBE2266291.1 hypothetical protein [Flavobacteriales bacterium]MBL1161801.1 hypothetical protein [Chlorobiota bacterium]MBW7853468.1 hypothetical protein [Candidatus Kapabacteria bacterium]MCC6331609.1 hypothetical protein [Ignavibacteria bacterium]